MRPPMALWIAAFSCLGCSVDAPRREANPPGLSAGGGSAIGGSESSVRTGTAAGGVYVSSEQGGVIDSGGGASRPDVDGAGTAAREATGGSRQMGGVGGTASGGRQMGGVGGTASGGRQMGGVGGTGGGGMAAGVDSKGGGSSCVFGSRAGTTQQTLVFVRHAETMANVCEDRCSSGTCCASDVCSAGCDDDCNCDANLTNFSPTGWAAVGSTLVNPLKALNLGWDRIVVSPAWRTQTTIRAYMESEHLCGEIVPELEECWNEDSGACSSPPWESEPYTIINFADGAPRLVPRAYDSRWDPNPAQNPRPSYDHSNSNAACEKLVVDRAFQYVEGLFKNGAMTALVVTHAMTGEGLLLRLTGSDEFYLENAPAYTVLTRSGGSGKWQVEVNNAR